MKKLIYITTISTMLFSSNINTRNAIGCANTKKIAKQKAKENLALKLAKKDKPKFDLNPGFSDFPVVVDDLNLEIKVIKNYKNKKNKFCVEVEKK